MAAAALGDFGLLPLLLLLSAGDYLLIGIDRRNSSDTVSAAYNDKQGVSEV